MANQDLGLGGLRASTRRNEPPLTGAEALFAVPYPAPDRTRERVVSYWLLLMTLLVGAVLVRSVPVHGNPLFHSLYEAVTAVVGVLVGGLALVRYYARQERIFLFVGTGFLGSALVTALHAVATGPLATGELSSALLHADAWTWWAAQLYLAVYSLAAFFTVSVIDPPGSNVDRSVYASGLLLAVLLGAAIVYIDLPTAVFEQLGLHRPYELIPAAIFAMALLGFMRRENWRRERFHHWMVVGLWIQVLLHTAYMAFSEPSYDAFYDAAHILRIIAQAVVLFGLVLSLYARLRLGGEAFAAERILEESRHQLQDFLDNASDLLQSTAPDGQILYANRAWKETLGYTDEEIESLDLFSIVHPSSREAFRRQFRRVVTGESLRNVQVNFVASDGHVITCSGNMNCRYEDGVPVATRSIFRDVTKQRAAERELEASRANLTALVENTGDGIWSVDQNLRLITFNSAFALEVEARTGREPQVGAPLEAIFRIDEVEQYRELFQRALAGARFSQVRMDEIDGQTRHFELFFNPIIGDRGVRGVVVFGKDVTPRKRAEEALMMAKEEAESANRSKSAFLASMSHELRTPLNSVIGFANVLRKNKSGGLVEQDLSFLDRILSNGKHLLTLINEVLDLAKVESGRMEIELSAVDLKTLVRETVGQLEGQVKGRAVTLRGDVPEGLRPMRTDPHRLKQVLINLAGNALKFTQDGEVVIRVTADPRSRLPASIAVCDSGIGIPPDRLEAIFEAFQQAEAGTARRFGGTGLGLTISKSICTLLGYDLRVESEPGVGSTFTIVVPADAVESPAPAPTRKGPELKDHPLVVAARNADQVALVVDDEEDSRLLLAHYLEEFGCKVLQAKSGEEGLAMARQHHPDLITVDLMMPGMSGWQFLQAAKADAAISDIPVVVVSIVAEEGGAGRLLGAVDLLRKPVEREEFLRVLWRALPRSGRRVLVVDDDAETRRMVESLLRSTELEVQSVANGREALAVLEGYRPDLILLDLVMPEMDGMTFLHEIRAQPETFALPVVVLTGKQLTPAETTELERIATGVLSKREELGPQLRGVLERVLTERTVPEDRHARIPTDVGSAVPSKSSI